MNKIMMKLGLVLGMAFLFNTANAQKVVEASVPFQKANVNGFVGTYPISSTDLTKIADDYFAKNIKAKKKKNKGFNSFTGVHWDAIPLAQGDIYYQAAGGKNESTLTILVSKGYTNYVSTSSDPEVAAGIQKFFTDFNAEIEAFYLAKKIEDQKVVIAGLEKEHKGLTDKEDKLKKERSDIEKQIDNNKRDYEKKQSEIDAAKQVLAELEAKVR